MKVNIRQIDPTYLPRRYKTKEDAERDRNAVYPCVAGLRGNPDYWLGGCRYEEDIFLLSGREAERVVKLIEE